MPRRREALFEIRRLIVDEGLSHQEIQLRLNLAPSTYFRYLDLLFKAEQEAISGNNYTYQRLLNESLILEQRYPRRARKLTKDQIYNSDYVYIPTHLVQRKYVNVDEIERDVLEKESRKEGIIWAGKIKGAAEITELLSQGIGPQIPVVALHPTIPDNQKNMPQFYPKYATVDPNDPDSWEEFYKPFTYARPIYAGRHCKRANCGLCRPLERRWK